MPRFKHLLSIALPLFALSACGSSDGAAPDASVTDASIDAPADASSDAVTDAPSDAPTDSATDAPSQRPVAWTAIAGAPMGPAARWGYMVAPVGDGTAYVYGGTTLLNTGSGTVSNELWLVDGRTSTPTFTRLTVTGAPPPRYCGCLAYIPASRTVLMIGGRNPSEAPAETWALPLDTMAWSRVMVPSTPGGVIGCAMGWSTARGALFHFGGGAQSTGFSAITSRFDPEGPRWVTVEATGPRGRYDDAFVPLPDGRRFVMTAGARGATAGPAFLNDTWIFDAMAETWEQVMTEGEAPAGRRNPWISVDRDGQGFLMAMGSTGIQPGEVLSDTWHLDLTTRRWTNLDLETLPDARGFITAIPGTGSVRGFLMGGFDNERVLRDVWQLAER
ncbi:MAG: kelch repeat-containing protein [Polyangiales bacterium]